MEHSIKNTPGFSPRVIVEVQSAMAVIFVAVVAHYLGVVDALIAAVPFVPLFRLGGCSDCGNSGSPGGGGPSSPFLCVWNGEKFEYENDFLLGNPSTLFHSYEVGRRTYIAGDVGPDLYPIQSSLIKNADGTIKFQIREIEPEESFIDHIRLERVLHPKGSAVVVDSSQKQFHLFDEEVVKLHLESKLVDHSGVNRRVGRSLFRHFSHRIKEEKGAPLFLPAGGFIEFKRKVKNTNRKSSFLLLTAHFHELVQHAERQRQRTLLRAVPLPSSFALRSIAVLFLALGVWVSGAVGNVLDSRRDGGISLSSLKDVLSTERAHADTPYSQGSYLPAGCRPTRTPDDARGDYMICPYTDGENYGHYIAPVNTGGGGGKSLVVEYWSGSNYHEINTIHPRYKQPITQAVEIPEEAIQEDGTVQLRVRATGGHYVDALSIAAADSSQKSKVETLTLTKAYHQRDEEDYAAVLQEQKSGEYLHTIAGDTVDVEFSEEKGKVLDSDGHQETYLFGAEGFYTPLSPEKSAVAGGWQARLDEEAKRMLAESANFSSAKKTSFTAV